METRRRETRAWLVRTASAQARLANVVRRIGNTATKSVVHRPDFPIAPGVARCERAARAKPVPRQTAALYPVNNLPIPLYNSRRASPDRRVVETPGASRLFANAVAGPVPAKSVTQTPRAGLERDVLRGIFAARWRRKNRFLPKAP